MGACDFHSATTAETPAEAFSKLVERALHDYGHAGYTGTIAEKSGFVMFDIPEDVDPNDIATAIFEWDEVRWNGQEWVRLGPNKDRPAWLTDRLIETYTDKWGPAVCFKRGDEYHFIGLASL